jgi:hypothetical protein
MRDDEQSDENLTVPTRQLNGLFGVMELEPTIRNQVLETKRDF